MSTVIIVHTSLSARAGEPPETKSAFHHVPLEVTSTGAALQVPPGETLVAIHVRTFPTEEAAEAWIDRHAPAPDR